jgi:diaminohydroxyphosphoribosylaminopyrimidine deaminase/5-amino-6-(5-phosphoribosylamino)uracil reductase
VSNPDSDITWMKQALQLAMRGEGSVEPNPMVGCVLVKEGRLIGEGWHQVFGGPHAEVNAIRRATDDLAGSTAYVTLEPCSHHGKTPPCAEAIVKAQIGRVVVAHPDPNPEVAGQGIERLRHAGLEVDIGLLKEQAAELLAPYLKRTTQGIPWIIAKWAMTLDGKIATADGDSQWISNETSRAIVHQLRGRVDAVMVGARTAALDDPLLTARPVGPRVATRIVAAAEARISPDSQLCRTANEIPTLIACGKTADERMLQRLRETGCEVWQGNTEDPNQRLLEFLKELGRRGMTNVLVEGGGSLLGSLNDLKQIDEVHLFLGPKLLGGANSVTPVGGLGASLMRSAHRVTLRSVQKLDEDVYIVGRTGLNQATQGND